MIRRSISPLLPTRHQILGIVSHDPYEKNQLLTSKKIIDFFRPKLLKRILILGSLNRPSTSHNGCLPSWKSEVSLFFPEVVSCLSVSLTSVSRSAAFDWAALNASEGNLRAIQFTRSALIAFTAASIGRRPNGFL